jgi:hypothetical protein
LYQLDVLQNQPKSCENQCGKTAFAIGKLSSFNLYTSYAQAQQESVEKFDKFLVTHPTVAKACEYACDGVRFMLTVSGTKALITAGLPKTLAVIGFGEVLSSAESWAGEKIKGVVEDISTSPTEAKRFMTALKKLGTTAGLFLGIKAVTKATPSLKTSPAMRTKALPKSKDALSERAVVRDGKVFVGEHELGPVRKNLRSLESQRKGKEFESHVGSMFGSDTRQQVSYFKGNEVRFGTKGSVRPDFVRGSTAIEVKSYDLSKGTSKLVHDVSKQAVKRAEHLPEGMKQKVVIDARCQQIPAEARIDIADKISKKSQNVITPQAVNFKDD